MLTKTAFRSSGIALAFAAAFLRSAKAQNAEIFAFQNLPDSFLWVCESFSSMNRP